MIKKKRKPFLNSKQKDVSTNFFVGMAVTTCVSFFAGLTGHAEITTEELVLLFMTTIIALVYSILLVGD
ncbi:hypothetical protein [Caviibacterium pharyngocola]|uniref:Uncharacterized protein n=1 Tax=Caviibacterium pharyngocola TaxID=28159 RepID=A0A2M8RVW0_9PAST|nr:hypothetical protein [Caviibacterium pharyngocola]PJG83021.1 hypothetical protein CVP04_06595 [Caviibacterium pharyngocola]